MRHLTLALAVLAVGCATGGGASGAAAPPAAEYVAIGSFQYQGGGASFSEDRVVGPMVNVSRRSDGSWGGTLHQQPFDVNVTAGRIRGVGVSISWEDRPGGVMVDGLLAGKVMHFEVTPKEFSTNGGSRFGSFQVQRRDAENFTNGLLLKDRASDIHPPEPQFALAVLSSLL